jgi:hypothetical protein
LDALVRTLDLTCATSQAILYINGVGFSIVDLVYGNRASVFAGSTTVALAGVYFDLNHFEVISYVKSLSQ